MQFLLLPVQLIIVVVILIGVIVVSRSWAHPR